MRVLETYKTSLQNWSRRRDAAHQLRNLTHRQLEDIGAFDARNADRLRGLVDGI